MTTHSLKIATLIAAGALIGASPALALDGKVVLDQLVKKGVLTPEEAETIIRKDMEKKLSDPAPTTNTAKEADTRKISVYGKVQTQFKVVNTHNRVGPQQSQVNEGFELRRLDIGVEAEISDSFKAVVDYRGETSNPTSATDAGFQADKAWIEYDTHDYGQILVGMKKATFGYEEYTSSSYILTIERGIVNNYFSGNQANATNLGLAERRMGVYYDTAPSKKIEKEGGTKFGIAVTNDIRRRFDQGSNDFAYYLNGLHVEKFNDTTFLDVGVNSVYSDTEANRKATVPGDGYNGLHSYGLEAYARLRSGNLTLLLNGYQACIENGRARAGGGFESTAPVGVVLMASYMVADSFEPVVSFNYLDTDGRGVNADQVIRNATTFATADRAMAIFTGANWYLTKSKSVKLSAGLELARLEGATQTSSTPVKSDVVGGRMQVQALF